MNFKKDFARYEFKYLISDSLAKSLISDISYFMELDHYSKKSDTGSYKVRSLYFDDPSLTAYYDKKEGLLHRSKFRLRTYAVTPKEESPIFLEVKGRHDSRVFKHRSLLGIVFSDLAPSINCDLNFIEKFGLDDSDFLSNFQFNYLKKNLSPIMLIDYDRSPFISKYNPDFRVTFDSQLMAYQSNSLSVENKVCIEIVPGSSVMEVKFSRTMPSWFHRIIHNYELQRISFSKICNGLDAWGIPKYFE